MRRLTGLTIAAALLAACISYGIARAVARPRPAPAQDAPVQAPLTQDAPAPVALSQQVAWWQEECKPFQRLEYFWALPMKDGVPNGYYYSATDPCYVKYVLAWVCTGLNTNSGCDLCVKITVRDWVNGAPGTLEYSETAQFSRSCILKPSYLSTWYDPSYPEWVNNYDSFGFYLDGLDGRPLAVVGQKYQVHIQVSLGKCSDLPGLWPAPVWDTDSFFFTCEPLTTN